MLIKLALISRRKLNPDTAKLRGQAFGSSSVCSLLRSFRLSLGDLTVPSCSSVCCVFSVELESRYLGNWSPGYQSGRTLSL